MPPSALRTPGPHRRKKFPVVIVQPAHTPLHLTARQRTRRLYATSVASSITCAATYDTGRGAGAGWVEHATVHERPWARDIIRDAAALAAAPDHPATLQIGRSRTAGIVAVVLHADVWSLLIRTGRNRVGHIVPLWSLVYSDAPTGFDPTMMPNDIGWCFDNDCSVDGVDWSDMTRAVLTAIT